MKIFPAIDLYQGMAVRLYKGDYSQMTIYSREPLELVKDFAAQGAEYLHLVDLEGAKSGGTDNLETIRALVAQAGLFTQVGGGIRSMNVVERYLSLGVNRVILGSAAVTDETFLREAVRSYGEQIAVGVDIRDGCVAIHGWTENSGLDAMEFCAKLEGLGVKTLVCTDISRDGAMQGSNHSLYRQLQERLSMDIIASGGVSSLDDVKSLAAQGLYGAIIGKAYYTKAISLKEAMEVAR